MHKVEFGLAKSYRLYEFLSGVYEVYADGFFNYAPLNSTAVSNDIIPFKNNVLSTNVDSDHALTVYISFQDQRPLKPALRKRAKLDQSCSGDQNYKLKDAL
ncbi:uncharacterized protein SETTUDRAFT_21727 [Exserohilum turcica Et28A]|uniref:Uncharacterized protein n=1 Tax=Exserohilum turcicum (strain 28A) TaxID=671987 RepID=R0IGJ6_EXST2|nr:uncharacterized protein SETTUDRAFT_21727 [Exserohilum turcica Et28A]EOA84375.1 hypothetical protein SETTUDRAFT_21727 [Exserohilum turcica Et28A]